MSIEQPASNAGIGNSPDVPPEPQTPLPEIRAPSDGLASSSITGVVFAVLGGLLAWGLLLAFHPIFKSTGVMPEAPPAEVAKAEAAQQTATLYNAILVLGWSGALIAGAMAVGEGWARRSCKMACWGFVGCALAGAFFGGVAGWIGHAVYQYARPPGQAAIDLEGTVVVQMTMLAVLGGGIGLTLGSLTGQAGTTVTRLLGGVLAGVFAGMLCPVGTAYLMPVVQTEHIVPEAAGGALLWLGLTGFLLGLIIPGMKMRRTQEAAAAPEPPVTDSALADEAESAGG